MAWMGSGAEETGECRAERLASFLPSFLRVRPTSKKAQGKKMSASSHGAPHVPTKTFCASTAELNLSEHSSLSIALPSTDRFEHRWELKACRAVAFRSVRMSVIH